MKILLTLLTVIRVAFVGDPQVDNEQELSYARKSVYSELRSRHDLDMVVVLGDLVNDKVNLLAPSVASLDSLSLPWFCVPGNHDKDVYPKSTLKPRDTASYHKALGYTDTAFVRAGVNFILMDNVRTREIAGYEGGLTDAQKQWLASSLASCSKGPIVLCAHIPFTQCVARDSLQAILEPYTDRMLMMCGHTHNVSRRHSEYGCEEVQAGAACGSWWRGAKDDRGVPYALMNCGAPRGYFVAEFKPSATRWYRLRYKAEGRPASEQLSVTDRDGRLYVNVYGASAEGKVMVKAVGKDACSSPYRGWTVLERSKEMAPEVKAVYEYNRDVYGKKDRAWRKAHRDEFIPLRRLASPHLWEGPSYGGKIKVKYSDGAMKINL